MPTLLRRSSTDRPVTSSGGGGGSLPNTDYGPDLRAWLRVPATNSEVVANGGKLYLPIVNSDSSPRTYYAGNVGDARANAGSGGYVHPFNSGLANNGWVLYDGWGGRPQVDLSPTATGIALTDLTKGGSLTFGDLNNPNGECSLRTGLLNMDFFNGLLHFCGTDRVRIGNCTNTYPSDTWLAHYNAARTQDGKSTSSEPPNDTDHINSQGSAYLKGNFTPTPFRFEQGGGAVHCSNIWLYAIDSHEAGDDGIYMGNTNYQRLVGCRVWYVRGGSYGAPYGSLRWTQMHNDAYQVTGYLTNQYIRNCMFAMHIMLGSEFGGIDNMDWDQVWQCASDGVGNNMDAATYSGNSGGDMNGTITNYKWFANGQAYPPTDPPLDYHQTFNNVLSGGQWNEGFEIGSTGSTPTVYTGGHIGLNHTFPSGVTVDSNGILTDVMQVVNHTGNPANTWRIANPNIGSVWAALGYD